MINVQLNSPLGAKKKYPYLAQYTEEHSGYYYVVLFTHYSEASKTTHGSVIFNPWKLVRDEATTFEEKSFKPFIGTLTISNE